MYNFETHQNESLSIWSFLHFCYTRRLRFAIGTTVLVVLALIWITIMDQPRFKSTGTLYINMLSKTQSLVMPKMTNWVEEQQLITKIYFIEQYFNSTAFKRQLLKTTLGRENLCRSEECLEALATFRKQLHNHRIHLPELEDMINRRLTMAADTQRYMLSITANTRAPAFSRILAKLAMIALVDANFANSKQSNGRVRDFLHQQINKVEIQLAGLEQSLVHLQSDNGVMASAESETKLTTMYMDRKTKLQDLQSEKSTVDLFLNALTKDQMAYKQALASRDQPSYMMFSQAQKRLDVLRYQISTSRETGKDGKAIALETEIDAYRKLIASSDKLVATDPIEYLHRLEALWIETKQKRDRLANELVASQSAMREANIAYRQMPEFFREISEVKRNIKITTDLYAQLRSRFQETNIQDAEKTNDLAVLTLPDTPVSPAGMSSWNKLGLILVGSPMLSLGLLFLSYLMIPIIRSPQELENLGAPVLGRWTKFGNSKSEDFKFPIVMHRDTEGAASNSVREVRLRLERVLKLKSAPSGQGQVLGIASHSPGEGKTFATVNLAYAFAAAEYDVAIVDLDWKQSDLHAYTKVLGGHPETSSADEMGLKLAVTRFNPHLDAIRFDFGGVDPRDFMESQKFAAFIVKLRLQYDLVFVDTPCLEGNIEPALVAAFCDSVVLMVNQRKAIKADILKSLETLREVTAGNLYSLLNFADEEFKVVRHRVKQRAPAA